MDFLVSDNEFYNYYLANRKDDRNLDTFEDFVHVCNQDHDFFLYWLDSFYENTKRKNNM
jgi:hypothetical protein